MFRPSTAGQVSCSGTGVSGTPGCHLGCVEGAADEVGDVTGDELPLLPAALQETNDTMLPALPSEPHDLPVDAVVTENGFTRLGAGSVS